MIHESERCPAGRPGKRRPAACFEMCCTSADCGSHGACNTMFLGDPLPSGVGLCVVD